MRFLFTLMLCFISLCLQARSLHGVDYRFYYVHGENYDELLKDINKKGPNNYHAYTKWHVRWRFKYRVTREGCFLKNIVVDKSVTVDFPRWKVPRNVNRALYDEWTRYTRALMKHELEHVDYAKKTQLQIETMLHDLPVIKKCDALGKLANRKANQILEKNIKLEKKFDEETDHGRTEGARFHNVNKKKR